MYGHDPLLITLLLVLAGLGIGCVQHRWPAIGEAIDVATKVLITLIGLLIFASSGTTEQSAPPNPVPAPSMSAPPSPAGQDHNHADGHDDADGQDVPATPAGVTPRS